MKSILTIKFLIPLFVLLLITGCKKSEQELSAATSQKDTKESSISIAAAANLRDVLEDLKQKYISEYPEKKIEITFGSSGMLVQQMLNGAPFDLFLSADTEFPEKLKESGKSVGKAEIYTYGKLALWSSKLDVSKGLTLLLDPEVKKIAIANPKLAPYGKSAAEALEKSELYAKVEKKIVWAENINQAAQFVSSGNADVGFIALSNALNKEMKKRGQYYELTSQESLPIAQSGIIIRGKNETEAKEFLEFIRSKKADDIWKSYGYQTVTEH
ncbi:molybdate ABC transporter substrate-binding protein [Chryseobacterium sp.]|uniref:molybdate ABC transporter substrate-binding protein n=1 Tax=Chryseobacterium sp. TaxID=1871047 RepID=UPI0025BD6B96|nr:molybdate ABC transporter substrate-binding protein [Chryseobacterium sp.]